MTELNKIYQEATAKRDDLESKLILRAWENDDFRKEFLGNPKKVFEQETGQKVPESVEIKALEETGNKIYFVIPRKPAMQATEGELTEAALGNVSAGLNFIYKDPVTTFQDGAVKQEPAKFLLWF